MASRRNLFLTFILGVTLVAGLFGVHALTLTHLGDADRYYHLALSRMLAEGRVWHLETLPQAESLGWSEYFPDKEYLFHVLTSAGYRLHGEKGAIAAVLVAGASTALLIYWFALRWLTALEAFACALAAFFTHSLVIRMTFLRPHVLAVPLLILLIIALARRRLIIAPLAAGAYVLAYHAFYMPLACLGVAAVLAAFEAREERLRIWMICVVALGGWAVGLVVNPYFPSNFEMGWLHAKIPFLLNGPLRGVGFGGELFPLNGPGLLKFFYFPFAVLAAFLAVRRLSDFESRLLAAIGLLFTILSFLTVRGGEYLVPVAGLLLAMMAPSIPRRGSVLGMLAALQLLVLWRIGRAEATFQPDEALFRQVRGAIAAIPPGPGKVYNCEWDTAPLLLYLRPELRFVDILDPSFLYEQSPGAFQARRDLAGGLVTDAHTLVQGMFGANFVLCRNPRLTEQLDADPAFRRMPFAGSDQPGLALFRAEQTGAPEFLRKLHLRILRPEEASVPLAFEPRPGKKMEVADLSSFVRAIGLRDRRGAGVNCAHLSADPSEIRRLREARFLGVGGGGAFRVWRNGKLLFASGREVGRARIVQFLVPLSPPLREADTLDLLFCSSPGAPFWTAALSLWTEEALGAVCESKATSYGARPERSSPAPFLPGAETCLAPIAQPAVPPAMRP